MSCGPSWPGGRVTRRGVLELIGGVVLVAMIPENPVVGGTVLRRAAIQSPNFVTGATGWAIRQDGSAEFNNVVIRNGQVVSGTALFYSGPPAAGNLVASISAASGTDSHGNAYLGGIASYEPSAVSLNQAVQILQQSITWYSAPAGSNGAGPWSALASITMNSLATQLLVNGPASGTLLSAGLTADTITSSLITASSSQPGGDVLTVVNASVTPTGPTVQFTAAAANDRMLGIHVSGDTSQRFAIDSAGKVQWGTGAALDTDLFRNAAGVLKTDGELDVGGVLKALAALSVVGGETADTIAVSSGQAAGKVLAVTDTTSNPSAPIVQITANANTPDFCLGILVAADTNQRFRVDSDGSAHWGPGNAAVDASLTRTAAGALTVGSTLIATVLRAIAAATGNQAVDVHVTGDTNPRLQVTGAGQLDWGPGNAATDCHLTRSAANTMQLTTADLDIATAGRGLQIKEGTNARMGTATLVAGTVTVSNTSVTANTRIFLTCQTPGGTPGFLRVSARTAGTSFTILSSSTTDTSVVGWLLLEPG